MGMMRSSVEEEEEGRGISSASAVVSTYGRL